MQSIMAWMRPSRWSIRLGRGWGRVLPGIICSGMKRGRWIKLLKSNLRKLWLSVKKNSCGYSNWSHRFSCRLGKCSKRTGRSGNNFTPVDNSSTLKTHTALGKRLCLSLKIWKSVMVRSNSCLWKMKRVCSAFRQSLLTLDHMTNESLYMRIGEGWETANCRKNLASKTPASSTLLAS